MLTNRMSKLLVLGLGGMGLALLSGCQVSPDSFFAPAFEAFVTPTPTAAARDAFNVYDADKRARSVALINASPFGGEAPYLRLYRLLIDDHDATVRATCAMALGYHGQADDTAYLIPLLGDESSFVRWQAARALQKLHHLDCVEPLIEVATEDQDVDVRLDAAFALGQYPQPAVFDALVTALNDRDYGVVHAAAHSLFILTGQKMEPDPGLWLAWADGHRRTLFDQQQPYGYFPYVQPRGTWDKMQFWKSAPPKPEPVAPRSLTLAP